MKIGITMYETSFPSRSFKIKVPHSGEYPLTDVLIKNKVTPYLLPTVKPTRSRIKQLLGKVDGLILGGGDDITPKLYHEAPLGVQFNYPERDVFEEALIKGALRLHKNILGICRGCQMINVTLGGNLYQNIYEQLSQPLLQHEGGIHDVNIDSNSHLYQIMGPRATVNSRHHQAIKKLAPGLKVVARADDGIIEGIENHDASIQGVQWHPEDLWPTDSKQECLFQNFFKRVARKEHLQ